MIKDIEDYKAKEKAWRTYETETLERAFHRAVGECLYRRIKVYHPGGAALSLGEMWEAIGGPAYRDKMVRQYGALSALARMSHMR